MVSANTRLTDVLRSAGQNLAVDSSGRRIDGEFVGLM